MKNVIFIMLLAFVTACSTQETTDSGPSSDEIVQNLYNAFAEGDMEALFAGLHEEVEWNEAENFIYAGKYVGHDAVSGLFGRLGEEWEYWNLADLEIHDMEGNRALAQGRYQAKYKANGNELDAQFAHYWEHDENGMVTKFQQYTDTKQSVDVTAAAPEGEE